MNKLVFHLDGYFDSDIDLIANNHKDLEDYLKSNYDWFSIDVKEDSVLIRMREGYETEIAALTWVKHV